MKLLIAVPSGVRRPVNVTTVPGVGHGADRVAG